MQKKTLVTGFIAGLVVTGASLYGWHLQATESLAGKVLELESEVTVKNNELLGYTKYSDYLYASKAKLHEQMKFIAAKVVREEGTTQIISRQILGLPFNATVAIWYTAEYSFGYNLAPGSYEITDTETGINIKLKKPTLVATPATSALRHKVLSGSPFTNSQLAVINLYQGIPARIKVSGESLAADEAVIALCEKKLISFLQDFLARQPGVRKVPSITISY